MGKFPRRLPRGCDLELNLERGVSQAKKESLGDLCVLVGMMELEGMEEIDLPESEIEPDRHLMYQATE